MKRMGQLILVLVTLFLITKTLAQQPLSNNLRASNTANLIAAPIATPVGGGSNGVVYQCCDNLLVFQKDLGDSTGIVPLLPYKLLWERLGKKIDRVAIYSISPDGKMVYMWVYETNKKTPAPYLVSVDLNLLTHLSNSQYLSGGPSDQLWSPDGSALMGMAGMIAIIYRPGKTKVRISSVQGNMLTWSKDGKQVYLNDGNNRLLIYNVDDGSKQRKKLSFLEEINRPFRGDSSKQEFMIGLGLSPDSDEILLLTKKQSESTVTVYKTNFDFVDASILATFDTGDCNVRRLIWSPNVEYVWLDARWNQGCDSRIFNAADGSVIWDRNFLFNDKGQYRGDGCGWSPDNHFVIYEHLEGPNTLSFWDPSQPAKPAAIVPFSGNGCPVWLH